MACLCLRVEKQTTVWQHHLNLKARNKRAPKFEVVVRCDDIYALNQWGQTPTQLTRCLTIAGLPVSSGDEAHVAFAAVASRHVQAVAALAQVAVLRTLVTVCGHTQSESHYPERCNKGWKMAGVGSKCMYVCTRVCDLSRRNHLLRIPPCMCSGMNPMCCDTQRCCCTCASHLSTHPGLQHTMYQSCGLLSH